MSRKAKRRWNVPSIARRSVPVVRGRRSMHSATALRRVRGAERHNGFLPPEDWHGPHGERAGYRIIVQPAGAGLRHVVTPEQIRRRLSELPRELVEPLEVVQLSGMTRKKLLFPCYGMQWGGGVYLYPIAEDLVEHFRRPPRPAQQIEAAMYGGQWEAQSDGSWQLLWTQAAIEDYYLNNILMHELGHLVDRRNRGYADRERYAEWFAIHYGYRPRNRAVKRRHHGT